MLFLLIHRETNLCGECLDRLQVKVVVQVEIVQVLAVDQQVEHVVTLTTDLEAHLHPVQLCGLEELGGLERFEQVSTKNETQGIQYH